MSQQKPLRKHPHLNGNVTVIVEKRKVLQSGLQNLQNCAHGRQA
jgi:hypothetical protein